MDHLSFTQSLLNTVSKAGAIIMDHFGRNVDFDNKPDNSPVTIADQMAEQAILTDLNEFYPDIPVIAEETVSEGRIPEFDRRFFLVDPLDGTREFIAGRREFTVNVALIENSVPTFGLIYAPAIKQLFVTLAANTSVELELVPGFQNKKVENYNQIGARQVTEDGLDVLVSYSHLDSQTEDYLKNISIRSRVQAGSSLKFCILAGGKADIYPRFGRTMEWDTAAGHAILKAAGGSVTGIDGSPFMYGKRDQNFANPGFIAKGISPS